jgi:hypothetical protein
VAPTPSDPETRSLVNPNGRDLESSALLSPSNRSRRDSILSEASEPPFFSAEEAEELLTNRGSISRQTIKSMFTGERSSRSPSRSRSPLKRPVRDIVYTRSHSSQTVDGKVDRGADPGNFEIGAESDTER